MATVTFTPNLRRHVPSETPRSTWRWATGTSGNTLYRPINGGARFEEIAVPGYPPVYAVRFEH